VGQNYIKWVDLGKYRLNSGNLGVESQIAQSEFPRYTRRSKLYFPKVMQEEKILFLCTGNYYRSRFAEHLFNHQANQQGLNWLADSRGLALERGVNNVGKISHYAVTALKKKGIILSDHEPLPQQLQLIDLETSNRIIALDKSEHLPLMWERFPQWADKIEYWLVHDIDKTSANEALGQIEVSILNLIQQLAQLTLAN
jgi:protein-tyrosine phosphatase